VAEEAQPISRVESQARLSLAQQKGILGDKPSPKNSKSALVRGCFATAHLHPIKGVLEGVLFSLSLLSGMQELT